MNKLPLSEKKIEISDDLRQEILRIRVLLDELHDLVITPCVVKGKSRGGKGIWAVWNTMNELYREKYKRDLPLRDMHFRAIKEHFKYFKDYGLDTAHFQEFVRQTFWFWHRYPHRLWDNGNFFKLFEDYVSGWEVQKGIRQVLKAKNVLGDDEYWWFWGLLSVPTSARKPILEWLRRNYGIAGFHLFDDFGNLTSAGVRLRSSWSYTMELNEFLVKLRRKGDEWLQRVQKFQK